MSSTIMIPTTTPTSKVAIGNDDIDLNSKYLLSNSSPIPSRHLRHDQQVPSPRLQPQWNADNKKNMNNIKQRKKHSNPSPAPFLSFQVENENCAVYVGNIPLDERSTKNCDDVANNDNEDDDENESKAVMELKAFLRDRINAAFKIPAEGIRIRACRIFSVVTNVYSNSDTDTAPTTDAEGGDAAHKSVSAHTNANVRQRSGRRVHRAACVEFEDPKIAEHTLALKFTSFHFAGQPHNRSSLRMRRWTSEPPAPSPPQPTQTKSLSPRVWSSPKQRPVPPPPRSKSVSPKISNLKRQQLPPPPPPRPKSVSPNILGRKQQQQQHRGSPVSSSLSTLNSDLASIMDDRSFHSSGDYFSVDGRASPSCSSSSCLVHVGNIPTGATTEDLRDFLLERMNKAFHGVTPPEIIRLGIRHSGVASTSSSSANGTPSRVDACVEFQEQKVALRATQLKNRRWYAKDDMIIDGNNQNDEDDKEDGVDDSSTSNHDDDTVSGRKRRNSMPLLEIEMLNPTKYDTNDFFADDTNPTGGNNDSSISSTAKQPEENEHDSFRSDTFEDGVDAARKTPARTSPRSSPKSLPTLTKKAILTIEEARECGFLVCTNPNKTPKCDHLFTVELQQGEENSCLGEGEVMKARMCHGYAFRGKVCRNHKKSRIGKSGVTCPFAHIDSIEQLKGSHDILSLLYYVDNNDEVEFIPGTGCSPQEYFQRQRDGQPKAEQGTPPVESTKPVQQFDSTSQSVQEILWELRNDLSAVKHELATTQQQLHKSELTRQSLLQQQSMHVVRTAAADVTTNKLLHDGKDAQIRSLQDEVARLRIDLENSNQRWKASALAAESSKREHALLQEQFQLHMDQEGKSKISTDLLQFEVNNLREELRQSRGESQMLQPLPPLNGSPIRDTQAKDPFQLDNFLEQSLSTLMLMTDGDAEEKPPIPRLTDIPMDHASSRLIPYKPVGDCSPMTSLGLPSPSTNSGKDAAVTDEIDYLVSCYGNQVSVMNGASPVVTRFLKLPMNLYHGRDIDVALVLTLPEGYPWNGIVNVHSDPRLSIHFGADSHYKKIVSESISGLLNVCRWEAESRQGNPRVLMFIMQSAERWVQNDWEVIQKKNWPSSAPDDALNSSA